jgi:hypothetical protein
LPFSWPTFQPLKGAPSPVPGAKTSVMGRLTRIGEDLNRQVVVRFLRIAPHAKRYAQRFTISVIPVIIHLSKTSN